jgi:hypothetical protein
MKAGCDRVAGGAKVSLFFPLQAKLMPSWSLAADCSAAVLPCEYALSARPVALLRRPEALAPCR